MKRKDYGHRFPMRPIELRDEHFYEDDEPVADVLDAWRRLTQEITAPPSLYVIGDPPMTVSPYWHVLPPTQSSPPQMTYTYTISTGTNTCEAA